MNFIMKHFNNIIKANNDNRLAIFIGAGISKSSESATVKLPTWDDLIKDLKKDLGLLNDENDFLKIAQLYFLEFKEFTYYEKLKSYFPNNIEPSLVHKMIFDINPQIIITTNWDTILEKTIDNNAYIYDVVSSDDDLVKSTLQKKLIKMHGEFKNHNIVFKEDDYLSYQHNFPLIENYVKSILSTHTVLFLGYSYNDVNLKHIIKWLQNHSTVSPPRYLMSFKQNSTQEKYLENHGITILVLNDEDKKYNSLGKYSNKLATFLELLANPGSIYSKQSDDEIVDYIYNKLLILNNLEGILLDQIRNVLTNCGFFYADNDLILLEFYSEILTTDLDEAERDVHNKFINILKKYDKDKYINNKLEDIFNILIKANISGIIITDDTDDKKKYIDIIKIVSKPCGNNIADACFNFNFNDSYEKTNDIREMAEMAYHNYQVKNYLNAYNILEEVIALCLKQRNYTQLFLSMFNRNMLLRILKYSFGVKDHEQYKNAKEYDLKEKLNTLPKDLQKALEPIYDFVNFSYLYKYAFTISKDLKKKEDAKRTIEQGGMVFNRNINESSLKHKNIVLFLLQNNIMIDDYIEYKTIIKYFLEITLIRQIQNNHTLLNKIELYSCVKYISSEELKLMFNKFYANEVNKNTNIKVSDKNKEWLIDQVLTNLGRDFIDSKIVFNNNGDNLKNVIFILSLIDLDKGQIDKIMVIFLSIISDAKNTIGIYESINNFLGVQYKLHETEISDSVIINLIEVIINKLIYKKYNMHDYQAITRNSISNIYGYAKVNKSILSNKELVSRLLLELTSCSEKEKIQISQSLLLNIYDIANQVIQNVIKAFVLDIDIKKVADLEDVIYFELLLVIREFKKLDKDIVSKLTKYIKQFEDGKRFSTDLYNLKSELDYLVNKMSYEELQGALCKINLAIENYESRKQISIF